MPETAGAEREPSRRAAPYAFSPLTPTDFLDRSARVFAERTAIVDAGRSFTYADFAGRADALTGVLADLGIGPGDAVAALCANSHVMLELHEGVPRRGAVLVPLNTRLGVGELAYIVRHSRTRLLVATVELADVAAAVAAETGVPLIVEGSDPGQYDALLTAASPARVPAGDESGLLSINYTSGTTGTPKGVMYHLRGAYLQALAMVLHCRLEPTSRYLWTLPMFHCHGWTFTWAVTAAGGTHVCLRSVDTSAIWGAIVDGGVTHLSGAPTVLGMIANAEQASWVHDRRIAVTTGGAPPSPILIERLAALGLDVTHLYGLTETFGPLALNEWQPQWSDLSPTEQSHMNARQGVGNVIADQVRVVTPDGVDVPADAETVGEVVTRGNAVMLGYFDDQAATAAAVIDGRWMRTGDVGVMHPDGYLQITDRAKDVIITGGENVSSVEVERIIDTHPAVLESALVAAPDEKWGEIPVAFVTLRPGCSVTADEIIQHVRERLAHYKAPRRVVFAELPKTGTGKIRKNELRQLAGAEAQRRTTPSG